MTGIRLVYRMTEIRIFDNHINYVGSFSRAQWKFIQHYRKLSAVQSRIFFFRAERKEKLESQFCRAKKREFASRVDEQVRE